MFHNTIRINTCCAMLCVNYALFVLQKELEVITKRLNGDVIVDMRFRDEIDEDKKKLRQLKRSIEMLNQPAVYGSDSHKINTMKIKMTIEVEVEDTFNFTDDEEKMWFENEVLIGDGTLMLHSNEIGDTIGVVKKVSNVQYEH